MNNLLNSYNEFQNNFGQGADLDYAAIVADLFSEGFTKNANGVDLVNTSAALIEQLQGVKGAAGSWSVDVKDVIASACNHKGTISYILKTEKVGNFNIIAIVNSSDQKKIDSIREVYYQF